MVSYKPNNLLLLHVINSGVGDKNEKYIFPELPSFNFYFQLKLFFAPRPIEN